MHLETTTRDAYALFVELYAAQNHMTEAEVREQFTESEFLSKLHQLHARHMAREFSASKLADLIGIPALNLYDLLEVLGMPVRHY